MRWRRVVHPYPPIGDNNSQVLILGSAPSLQSVKLGFYYMHPQNRFWRVLGALLDYDLYNATKQEKIDCLIKNKIAMHDIVKECDIIASDDSKITNVIPGDIPGFIKDKPITKIYGSGQRAYKELGRHYPELLAMAKPLPSTSTANARYTLPMLIECWKVILED